MPDRIRTVLTAVDDLFFAAKIQSVARSAGVQLVESRTLEQLQSSAVASVPDLVVLDLHSTTCRPMEAIRFLKADPRLRLIPVVGFLSHVQGDLERAAREAGCDRVLPRSKFFSRLAQILAGAE
jgi:CheY-like chemotaxis protein